jgi:hypothetical protein
MKEYTSARRMGVLEAAARIVQLGGTGHPDRTAGLRADFEARTGAFTPEDPWFEERSRAFWCDAVTRGRLGREVEGELGEEDRAWVGPLERAHRGLFRRQRGERRRNGEARKAGAGARAGADGADGADGVDGGSALLVDVWSGAEIVVTSLEDASRTELDAGADALFDARVAGSAGPMVAGSAGPLLVVALLPGAIFHPPHATEAIGGVLEAARTRGLSTHETLDALLRMERSLRALSRVKTAYAYRAEALSAQPAAPARPVPWADKGRK